MKHTYMPGLAGLLLIITALAVMPAFGQGQKVSERTALSAAALAPASDILPIVDISAGAAGSKKITVDDLFTGWGFTSAGADMAKASNAAAQRSLLELGTAATLDQGTAAGNLVRLDPTTAQLPAVDGSLLTNLPSTGPAGPTGPSAYDVAVADGFVGDEAAWLASLIGATGPSGAGLPGGGTTGQVLAKSSEDDYAYTWTAPTTPLTDSASLRAALSDETGTGLAVFATSPTITTPTINVGSDATGDILYRGGGGGLARLAPGTNGHVLTLAAGVPTWAATAAGVLSHWTEAVNTASPNATVPVTSFAATNAATHVDVAIVPKGSSGAIIAAIPDGTSAGGNKRGPQAVDFQLHRSSSTRVASGTRSVICGGGSNTASGGASVVGGGTLNTTSGSYAAILGGDSNTASASHSAVGGGVGNAASGEFSTIPGGRYASTRGLYGAMAHSSSRYTVTGDAQSADYKLMKSVTSNTPAEATLGNQTAGAESRIVLPNNSTYEFTARGVARSSGDLTKTWRISGTIRREGTAATTALVGSISKASNGDTGTEDWDVVFTADTTNGHLKCDVTGAASGTTRFLIQVETVELVY
jgi:hypothetical protein